MATPETNINMNPLSKTGKEPIYIFKHMLQLQLPENIIDIDQGPKTGQKSKRHG
jgi:hypothetical protein